MAELRLHRPLLPAGRGRQLACTRWCCRLTLWLDLAGDLRGADGLEKAADHSPSAWRHAESGRGAGNPLFSTKNDWRMSRRSRRASKKARRVSRHCQRATKSLWRATKSPLRITKSLWRAIRRHPRHTKSPWRIIRRRRQARKSALRTMGRAFSASRRLHRPARRASCSPERTSEATIPAESATRLCVRFWSVQVA
jgi:hypothetical protein